MGGQAAARHNVGVVHRMDIKENLGRNAADKILELREIEKEIAEHRSAISDLERRRRVVLELEGGRRLDPRQRISEKDKRRILAAACSGR
jgi:hypothetical protein